MKITCLGQNLKDAILTAERNTAKNQTLQVLNSILISTENGKIVLRATNLETALELRISGKIEESGKVVIPAKTLGSFLSNVSGEQILLQSQNNNLFIKTKNIQTIIRGYPADEFPLFPKIEPVSSFVFAASHLKNSLSSVITASSQTDLKPELSSVCFRIFKNTLNLVATDSFRLAEKTIVSKNFHEEKMVFYLVPQRSANELLKLLDKNDNIEIGFNKNQLIAKTNSIKFISRLTEGTFPDYEQIIPKTSKTTCVVKRADILHHIKLASVFVGRLNDIMISFDLSKKALFFNSSNADVGEHSSNTDAVIQGEDVSVKFNWRYLLDGVSQVQSEYVVLNLSGDQSPLVIKGKGDTSYLYLVMPMRGI